AINYRRLQAQAVPALVGLLVVALLGPTFLGGTAFACDRLTLPFAVLLCASVSTPPARRSCPAVALLFLLARAMPWAFPARGDDSAEMVQALLNVPKRSTVVTYDIDAHHRPAWQYHRHAPDWALLERPLFIAQNFAKNLQQPMVFRPEFEE